MPINTTSSDELLKQILDTQEGVKLGLGGFAEVLKGVNNRLEKMDAAETQAAQVREEEDLRKAHQEFINQSALAVLDILKKDGIDVDGETMRSVSHPDVFDSKGGGIDEQKNIDLHNATSEVQKPLQLMMDAINSLQKEMKTIKKHMLKEHASQYEGDIEEDIMTEDAELGMGAGMDDDMDFAEDAHHDDMGDGMEEEDSMEDDFGIEESADYPEEDDEDKVMDDFDKMYKSLKNKPQALKKFMAQQIKKQTKKQTEAILKQQGFHRDESVMPKRINGRTLGIDDSTVGTGASLKKSNKKAGGNKKESEFPKNDIIKKNSERPWEDLMSDYIHFVQPDAPSGFITPEMEDLYN